MFKKILVANRGEIALRILWACKELGIRTVAVRSEADRDSLHSSFADENICIGPAPSASSYLNITSILSAAEVSGAEAIHPGYGFLSENARFAEICSDCGVKFIGPTPELIRLMGDKATAREQVKKLGIPIIPGSDGPVKTPKKAHGIARSLGYPVILKAVAGGGGRGMRVANEATEIENAFNVASSEAQAAFGDGRIYLEKYFDAPRHIEVQILADSHGTVVQLGERECSIQRKHQKLVEEAPSPAVDDRLREELGERAISIARAVSYENAGTVEFLLDQDGSFYFMEMNTRIQVEHPVTEFITGMDLIKEQIRIAAGEAMTPFPQPFSPRGHAIECRINAEHPETFIPSPGTISVFHPPGGPGVRVDTAAYASCVVSSHYDSMIAKLITHGRDREEAIQRMRRSLEVFVIEGIATNIPLHQRIVDDAEFRKGNLSTRFLERRLAGLPRQSRGKEPGEEKAASA